MQEAADKSAQSRQLKAFQQIAQNSGRSMQLRAMSTMMNPPAVRPEMQRVEQEAPLQGRLISEAVPQEAVAAATVTPKPNNSGLPENLKSAIESLSGMSMDHVRVHYNSAQPAQLNAHAYAQGSEIHLATGQERHLPHELWHVVQQAQGRVRPTLQMKAGAVNDDPSLEKEADIMGAKAAQFEGAHVARNTVSMSRARTPAVSLPGHPIAQRMLVIDAVEFEDANIIRERASKALGATESSVENLVGLGTDPEIIARFPDWDTATARYNFANDHDSLALAHDPEDVADAVARSGLPPQIVNTALFRIQMSSHSSLASQVLEWALAEARSLEGEISDQDLLRPVSIDFKRLKETCSHLKRQGSRGDPAELRKPAIAFHARITDAYHAVFKLQDRDMRVEDGVGGKHAIYGYHVTKLNNIPGIRESGLQPHMGASDRGSVAMSTADQKEGSVKTSANMVAFAKVPSTFRPYINQYEDRRQMVSGAPMALKPLMLRFHIDAAIGKSNVIEGADFMDGNALNTDKPVLPEFIEVLTPKGWIPIDMYDTRTALVEMRSGADNARAGSEWAGKPVLLSGVQIATMKLFPTLPDLFKLGATQATSYLEGQRDIQVYDQAGVKLTFRGASMQTSGNPSTWDYSFTALPEALPGWLETAHGRYMKEIGGPASKQLAEFAKRGDR
ncbi:DUF4157 domain-containing protein [Massilia sp. CFBP9026]|uniref:eCIS core domain-containing protein n=1 Tax=Massilia sp. CFBP9026 TaxID=3096536 RepID=UPI002A6A2257|nr:DUF4157 domain-containing protein [Massilia sp. CFBP9026]MDY0964787.1 DUF4157 domain-containing protein [Massilia sp. CFBP9026]